MPPNLVALIMMHHVPWGKSVSAGPIWGQTSDVAKGTCRGLSPHTCCPRRAATTCSSQTGFVKCLAARLPRISGEEGVVKCMHIHPFMSLFISAKQFSTHRHTHTHTHTEACVSKCACDNDGFSLLHVGFYMSKARTWVA